jgi:hypothetical protein
MISLGFLITCLIVWQLSNFIRIHTNDETNGMGAMTSLAILGFIGTAFFLITTLIIFAITIFKRVKKE